jgi:hypothetical protein
MNVSEVVAHCRTHRQGVPEGDLRDPRVLADLLSMVLSGHLERLECNVQEATGYVFDSRTGKTVPTIPGRPAPSATEDGTARALATLIGYLQDAT